MKKGLSGNKKVLCVAIRTSFINDKPVKENTM